MFNFYKIPLKHTSIFSGVVREQWIDYIEERKAEGDYFQATIAFILSQGYNAEDTIHAIKEVLAYKERGDNFYE